MRTDKQRPFTITPSKEKKVYLEQEQRPKLSLEEFKEKLSAAAKRRRKNWGIV